MGFTIFFVLESLWLTVYSQEKTEPQCLSRWDYDFKTMSLLTKISQQQERMEEEIQRLETELKTFRSGQKQLAETGGRQTYIRWGRSLCNNQATLIYKGYTAGKGHSHKGSGTDTVCLPETPSWFNYTDGNDKFPRGYIYGAEIDVNEPSNIFPYQVWEQDIPCAVCMPRHNTVLMVPGSASCPIEWEEEYHGYLMAGYYSSGAHNYKCVDSEPEAIPNGSGSNDQHIFYLVEAQCGSLPCPPYVQGRELACVVCSK